MNRILLIILLTLLICVGYYSIFPNDFFLSKKEYLIDKERFNSYKTTSFTVLYDKTRLAEELLPLISSPDSFFDEPLSFIKNNCKRTVVKIIVGPSKLVIKRYNYKNWFDWITKCPFRSSKAYRAWYYMNELKRKGVFTTTPIAIIEKRIGPFWLETYLVTEYLEGTSLNQNGTAAISETIYKELLNVLAIFFKNKWLHRDFIASNMILQNDKIAIIDLDEMHSYAFQNSYFRKKFLKKHIKKFQQTAPQNLQFDNFLMTYNYFNNYTFPLVITTDDNETPRSFIH